MACHSRPDISFEVSTLSRFNNDPGFHHIAALKQLLQYLKFTYHYGLHLGGRDSLSLTGFADAGTIMDPSGRGVGGFTFQLGTATVAHKSKWFASVYPSSTELELAALFLATSKAVWIRKLLASLGYNQTQATQIFEDNEGTIKYVHSQERAGRMQHVNVKFHFIREKIGEGVVDVQHIASASNTADIFTKTLRGSALLKHRTSLGVLPLETRNSVHILQDQ